MVLDHCLFSSLEHNPNSPNNSTNLLSVWLFVLATGVLLTVDGKNSFVSALDGFFIAAGIGSLICGVGLFCIAYAAYFELSLSLWL